MKTFLICAIVSLLAFAHGQIVDKELQCSGGYCVSRYLCANGTYIDDPKRAQDSNLIGLRIDDTDECQDYMLICCPINPSTPLTTPDPLGDDDDDFRLQHFDVPAPSPVKCGEFNERGLVYDLAHNDSLAQYAEYPWVVYIRTAENNFVCGGSLISVRFVVTTAHNTDGKSKLIARFGEWDTSTTSEPFAHKEIDVADIIKHPDYVNNPIQNDIALLYLSKDVQFDRHIRPICLPPPNAKFVGERCISNGWGEQSGVYAKVLKKLTLPVIDNVTCLSMLRFAGVGPFFTLREGFICAGAEHGVDTCKGDGGSPLACQTTDGTFVLAGIVSWGIGCGGLRIPGVYVDVSHYTDWINETIKEDIQL